MFSESSMKSRETRNTSFSDFSHNLITASISKGAGNAVIFSKGAGNIPSTSINNLSNRITASISREPVMLPRQSPREPVMCFLSHQ